MPQMIFFALVGLAAWIGYRSFTREAARVTARVRRSENERRTGSQGTLVRDPKTGVFRPARD